MGLSTYLINGLNSNNLRFCNIIINGSYFMVKGKLICCEVNKHDPSALNFYVTRSDVNGDTRDFISGAFNGVLHVYSTEIWFIVGQVIADQDLYSNFLNRMNFIKL